MEINLKANCPLEIFPTVSEERWEEIARLVEVKIPAIQHVTGYNTPHLIRDIYPLLNGPEEFVVLGYVVSDMETFLQRAKLPTS